MWIPVITVLWSLGNTSAYVNFPMVNFPFSSEEKCYQYVNQVRTSIMKDPQYLEGYSVCVEIPLKGEAT
tara:strand:+ start:248 stop:454 length:207 start_codon:yes stop_codon:yes gene_type:complete